MLLVRLPKFTVAMIWKGDNFKQVAEFCDGIVISYDTVWGLSIAYRDDSHDISIGDYIIRDDSGDIIVCCPGDLKKLFWTDEEASSVYIDAFIELIKLP